MDADNAESYAKLVRAAAENKELDPDKVLEQLDRLERDPAEFAADVEALATRIELKAQTDKLPALEKERATIEAAVAKHNQTREAAHLEADRIHAAAVNPLLNRNTAIGSEIAAIEDARQRLLNTSPQDRKDALTKALRAAGATAAHVTRLEVELADVRDRQLPHAEKVLAACREDALKTADHDGHFPKPRRQRTPGTRDARAGREVRRGPREVLAGRDRTTHELQKLREQTARSEALLLNP